MKVPGTGSGERKRKRSSTREYPCVWRLRRRRLLAYLSTQGFNSTFQALSKETKVFFSVAHLQRLVRLGQWGEAIGYCYRIVPKLDLLGEEGRLFFSFLSVNKVIHSVVICSPGGAAMTEIYERELMKHPNTDLANVKLIRLLSALNRSDLLRTSVNWHLVRQKAADLISGLIARTPEFNDLVRVPDGGDKTHDILPIRSCSCRPRHHMKKIVRIPASDLAKFYLQKKMSLLSVSSCEGISTSLGLSCKATALLADLIDLCVRAGMDDPVVQAQHPFEVSCNKVPKCKQESSASSNHSVVEVSVSAKCKQVCHPLKYPCVLRLRHRRLLAFLRWHTSGSTFNAFVHETNVFFSIKHLQHLVFLGQWDGAIKYVSRFVPSLDMLGVEGIVFLNFLRMHKALHYIAAGEPHGALVATQLERNLKKIPNPDPGTVRLTRVLLTMLRYERLRASVDWSCVRSKAAEIVKDVITKTPEFSDLLRLPNCQYKPHNVLPIGSCSHQRHHMKERRRTPASDIAKFYLQKKRSLPSSSHREGNSVVQSVEAGLCRVIPQGHSFEDSRKEVVDAQQIEERKDSPLVKSIKEAQALIQSVYEKTIISGNDRSEAKRELLDAYNILNQCVLMAKTGGISVVNRAPDALPSHNSADLTSLRTI